MSAEEILQTAQRRLIVAEQEIRQKAKAAEAMLQTNLQQRGRIDSKETKTKQK